MHANSPSDCISRLAWPMQLTKGGQRHDLKLISLKEAVWWAANKVFLSHPLLPRVARGLALQFALQPPLAVSTLRHGGWGTRYLDRWLIVMPCNLMDMTLGLSYGLSFLLT